MAQSIRRLLLAAIVAAVVLLFSSQAATAALTTAQNTNTLAFLKSFLDTIPGLESAWTGDDWCSWPYLDCSSSSNITLIIDGANLAGSLPELDASVTGSQVALNTIAIMNMNVTGGFRASWKSMSAIKVLNFANTNIYGTLPSEWNAITSLTSVYVKNSSACGNMPSWTSKTIVNIDLSENYIRGTLPANWSAMTSLQSLDISENHLCGCIPDTWNARTLMYAAYRALGIYGTGIACTNTTKCSAYQVCSKEVPDYRDASAAPVLSAVAAATVAAVMAAATLL